MEAIERFNVYCLDNMILMNRLNTKSIDLIYADVLYGSGSKFKDFNDILPNKRDVFNFYEPRIKEMYRLLSDRGTLYLHLDFHIIQWVRTIADSIFGYENLRREIIVPKREINDENILINHENIIVYSKTDKFIQNSNMKEYGDIWMDLPSNENLKTNYDAEKNIELLKRIILSSSNENSLVLDPFLGSGNFVVAASELKRNYVGCDVNQKAIDITRERLDKLESNSS